MEFSGYQAVVIGCSAGGFAAMKRLLSLLKGDFPLPIVIASHLSGSGKSQLADLLGSQGALKVEEAADKKPLRPGTVYVAVPDYHLLLEPDLSIALNVDPRVNYCRPSIDVLFESASDSLGPNVIGIVLTGANADGAAGLALLRERGGLAIVQDPQEAEVDVMPASAIAIAEPDHILPLDKIAEFLTSVVAGQ